MATYVNDLRLKEIGTGESSGTWGTETNVNLELIGEALSFGTEAITTNADTHTSTVADGSTDPARSMYIKYTGTLDSACTITIAPNTLSRLHFIENGTSGSQNIIISQGSGANVTIPPGDVKVVYLDGAGSGAAVVDAFASLNVVDLKVGDDLTFTSDSAVITFGADGDTTLTHTDGSGLTLNSTNKLMFNDASQFIQGSSATVLSLGATDEIDLTATAIDINGTIDVSGTSTLGGNTTILPSSDGDALIVGKSGGANLHVFSNDSAVLMTNASAAGSGRDGFQIQAGSVLTEIDTVSKISVSASEVAINDPSADTDFRVESNGKTHMLFVDGGEDLVLIGTGTKSVVSGGDPGLQVSGNGFDSMIGVTRHDSNAFASQLMLAKSRNATVGSNTILQDNDGVGAIGFFADDGTNLDSQVAYITAEIDGTPGENDTPGALVFSTTADGSAAVSERMRIDDQGLVGINWGGSTARLGIIQSGSSTPGFVVTDGSTSDFVVYAGYVGGIARMGPSAGALAIQTANAEVARFGTDGVFFVNATSAIGPGMICAKSSAATTGAFGCHNSNSGGSLMRFANAANNAVIGTISNNGDTAVAYNTTSDYRLKENINYTWEATNRLKQLKPAQFNFISDESNTTIDGFIAHEVSSVVPSAVTGEKDGVNEQGDPEYQGLDNSKLVPLLVKTIQELEARITALES